VRVYLPATTTLLRQLVEEGRLTGPHTAFAVTPGLRDFYSHSEAEADSEELEYAALLAAARASLRLLDLDPMAARRRAVVAADVPDAAVTSIEDADTERGAVRVTADVTTDEVASAHIDVAEAEDDVRAAVNVVLEADLGSDDAQFVVDQAEGHELAWYATQEIGPLLDLL
jgi:multidrug efflux pump subunit AcrA (membrane-fusion protein)